MTRGRSTAPARAWIGLAIVVGLAGVAWAFVSWALPPPVVPAAAGVSFDRRDNALWLGRRWIHEEPSDAELDALAGRLAAHGISTVYPFLGPMNPRGWPGWRDRGVIRTFTHARAASFRARFRSRAAGVRVIPWTGGVLGQDVLFTDRVRIAGFLQQVSWLVGEGGFDGVHLNVEPLADDDPAFLRFLGEVKATLPHGKVLSVAAYPPTTPLHPYKRVHWSVEYIRRVCEVADDLGVMSYDTALRWPRIYERLMASWTRDLAGLPAAAPAGCEVRMGVPTYEDVAGWHDPPPSA
ncbi:MAG: hypothetical protein IPK07_19585 [Deltaproteobacteria bacterium]|nr:hypothetical protein [Deltaproteobacteria bacterium]